MHDATGLPLDVDLHGIPAGIVVEARGISLVGDGVVEAGSRKLQYGRCFPRGCSLHREQHDQQHGPRYSARRPALTRARSRCNSVAITALCSSADSSAEVTSMRFVRHAVPILALLSLAAAPLAAQNTGTITGRVMDSTSQQSLPGVTIQVVGADRKTLSAD